MAFEAETPLEDVLKYIKQATTDRVYVGIPIYVDPEGLKEANASLSSVVAIELEGVPLKTTLRLLLKQIGLAYCVRDGILIISSPEGIGEELQLEVKARAAEEVERERQDRARRNPQ